MANDVPLLVNIDQILSQLFPHLDCSLDIFGVDKVLLTERLFIVTAHVVVEDIHFG